jgi:hypothetical protein
MKIDAGRALSDTLAGISTSIAGTAEVWTVFRHFHVYSPSLIYYSIYLISLCAKLDKT